MVRIVPIGQPAARTASRRGRIRPADRWWTDGPFLEAKEYMGGFYLIDCESQERACELVALIPDTAIDGLAVEVRPAMFSVGAEM